MLSSDHWGATGLFFLLLSAEDDDDNNDDNDDDARWAGPISEEDSLDKSWEETETPDSGGRFESCVVALLSLLENGGCEKLILVVGWAVDGKPAVVCVTFANKCVMFFNPWVYIAVSLNPPLWGVFVSLAVGCGAGFVMWTTGLGGAVVVAGCLPPVGLFLPCQIRGVEMKPRKVREVLGLRWPGGLEREGGGLGWGGSGGAGAGARNLGLDAGFGRLGTLVGGLDWLPKRDLRWEALPGKLGTKAGLVCPFEVAEVAGGLSESETVDLTAVNPKTCRSLLLRAAGSAAISLECEVRGSGCWRVTTAAAERESRHIKPDAVRVKNRLNNKSKRWKTFPNK